MSDFLILQKTVDRSILTEGISIPVTLQSFFYEKLGFTLKRGESKDIIITVNDQNYPAVIKNQMFDIKKYPNHKDILQIRYKKDGPLAKALQSIFFSTYDLCTQHLLEHPNKEKILKIPDNKKEVLAIYATPVTGTLLFDCIPTDEFQQEITAAKTFSETIFERLIDDDANINERNRIVKIRKISRAIGDTLKEFYGYRCQICGEYIGEKYGSRLIHAHHIDYFINSLNNNSENVMVVCPNHHFIIHDKNPEFDRRKKIFIYPNGYREGLLINKHL